MAKEFAPRTCLEESVGFSDARLNDAIAYQRFADTYLVVLTDGGRMVFLNETAGEIVEALDRGVADRDVPREMCRRYGIDSVTAERDYAFLRSSFLTLGLLVRGQGALRVNELPRERPAQSDTDLRESIKSYCTKAAVPFQAYIEMTAACNLRCTHCYLPATKASGYRGYVRAFWSLLDELREIGCLELIFTGGEPLVQRRLLSICEYARRLRFSVIIKTNATLLNDAVLAAFRRMHITEVQVSLYSMDPSVHDAIVRRSGSHAKTLDALKRCHSAGQRCRLSCVVMRSNFHHLDGLVDFARSIDAPIGFDLLVTRQLDGSLGSLEERLLPDDLKWLDRHGIMADIIFRGSAQIRKPNGARYGLSRCPIDDPDSSVCGAARTVVAIDARGNVRPCVAFPWELGNVREQPLREILADSNKQVSYIRSLRNGSFKGCQGCSLASACPRCIATVYQETGSPVGKAEAICLIAPYHQRYGADQRPGSADTEGTGPWISSL